MNGIYPVNLSLKNKRVVIIGGGKIAYRKFQKLKEELCHITVVSPEFKYDFRRTGSGLSLIKDIYRKKYIEDADLIISASDDAGVNDQAVKDSYAHQWVNHTGDRTQSDFHNMMTVPHGDIKIHVSTEGKDIQKAQRIAAQLEKYLKTLEEEDND